MNALHTSKKVELIVVMEQKPKNKKQKQKTKKKKEKKTKQNKNKKKKKKNKMQMLLICTLLLFDITRLCMMYTCMSKRQQSHRDENVSPRPSICLQWTTVKFPYHRAGYNWPSSLYTGTPKDFLLYNQVTKKLKMKTKQNMQRPEIPDLEQFQNTRRG